MAWQQLQLRTSAAHSESLEQLLLEFGAVAISFVDAEDQPLFQIEPGSTVIWDATILVALFELDHDLSQCLAILSLHPAIDNAADLKIEILQDQDWERAWMDEFHAMQYGPALWICPSWQTPPDPQAINIMLDPGLAFGSGTHATTALCLEWLSALDINNKTVVDYGSGSGVLAIGAALLGADRVIAVDNDPQAITATLDNSQRNHIDCATLTAHLPQDTPQIRADVLIANILAGPLLTLAPTFLGLLKPSGSIVLSGILEEQISMILKVYEPLFDMQPPQIKDGWVRLSGTKK
ncbi:MAG: ribosomal protein L11 methyltransferase [Pseudohongiellaceae bacterium]|jgi:ribosomal protein L11 methyltransferase